MTATASVDSRLARLRARLPELGVDALFVTQSENRAYLSGFTGSAGALMISGEDALLATDFRYYEQVELEAPAFELVKAPVSLADILPGMVARCGVRRLAFEADHATYGDVQTWMAALADTEFVPTRGVVVELRAVKEPGELSKLREAIALGDEALAAALATAWPGITERELAWSIESYMRTHGAEAAAFDIIVACGPNGARPHARTTSDPIQPGQPVVIDMGAMVGSYRSDLTRTICFGEPADPDRFWPVYNTVLQAQMAAEAGLRPGMSGPDGDALARDVIVAAGYGDLFGHGLGHGIGLAIHELPRLGRLSRDVLVLGHVVTVEPGIYVPGWGGVRIEDVVLITGNGVEVLTRAPKEPII